MKGEANPAGDPNWGPNRLTRDWSPKPADPGMLYDPIIGDEYPDPEYDRIYDHGKFSHVEPADPRDRLDSHTPEKK